MCIL
ncbi:hypothetical protein F383_11287 [Gossypium arboreum]|jgi:hypothetical protein